MKQRIITITSLAAAVLAADQLTKVWARQSLMDRPPVTLVDNYLRLAYYENPGVAFSLGRDLPGGRFLLIAVGLLVLVFVWRIVRQIERRQRTADIAFAFVAGGAIGNIVDRIWLGRVIDFIVMHWQHRYVWPAYNVADIALCVGVGLLLIAIGLTQPKRTTTRAGAKSGSAQRKSPKKRRKRRR